MTRAYDVHCHVGSLEIQNHYVKHLKYVHCHVGSLEKLIYWNLALICVHCHVGSLESRAVLIS